MVWGAGMGGPDAPVPRGRGGPHSRGGTLPPPRGQGNRQGRWQDSEGPWGALRRDSGPTHSHLDWPVGLESHHGRPREPAQGRPPGTAAAGSQGAACVWPARIKNYSSFQQTICYHIHLTLSLAGRTPTRPGLIPDVTPCISDMLRWAFSFIRDIFHCFEASIGFNLGLRFYSLANSHK